MQVVRSRPELVQSNSATRKNSSCLQPHTWETTSGVYRAKCRRRICITQRGCCKVGSRCAFDVPFDDEVWGSSLPSRLWPCGPCASFADPACGAFFEPSCSAWLLPDFSK